MADLILTIDSDDEQQHRSLPSAVQKPAKQPKESAKSAGKKRKRDAQDHSKPEYNDNNDEDAMDKMFIFDARSGGGMVSRTNKFLKPGQWDLDNTIERFRKKNAPPRVTVDDIIARRQNKIQDAEGSSEGNGEDDQEEFAGLSSNGSNNDDEDKDAFFGAQSQEEDDDAEDGEEAELNEDEVSPDLGSDDVAGDADEQEQESESADEDEEEEDDLISPFAVLANAAGNTSDAEDEALNFQDIEPSTSALPSSSTYFGKAPLSQGPQISSNEALSDKSTLPPFSALPGASLSRPILLGLSSMNLTTPTPVQARTIPVALLGKDIVGSSITGSGKTVAFWVGVLERLLYRDKKQPAIRVVVICPTRELAVQVHGVGSGLARYTDIRFSLCVGGLSLKAQEAELRTRPDVVVCTPGRLIDHVRNTASFNLETLEILIIDEADRILEEGFRDELSEIINSCPHNRQTMLFSATITEDINTLTRLSLRKPVRIAIDVKDTTSKNLIQEFIKIKNESMRTATLVNLVQERFTDSTIIFFRSKKGAHWIKILFGLLGLKADELHGNLSQEQRLTALQRFKDGQVSFLLATDLASRGLDIRGITSVINYDAPKSFEIYLHRVGRTARAGKAGRSITLISENDNDERKLYKLATKSTGVGKEDTVTLSSVDNDKVKVLAGEIAQLKGEIMGVLQEEAQEKELRGTEMQIQKGQNLLDHKDEIYAKPKRTWFQTGKDKASAREKGAQEWSDKMGESSTSNGAGGRRDRKAPQPILNHKQRRRKEALDEIKSFKKDEGKQGPGTMGAVKAVKKAARPTAIRQFKDDDAPSSAGGAGKKNKNKGKKGKGGFGGDKKSKSSFNRKGGK